MKKNSVKNKEDVVRYNPSIENGLNETEVNNRVNDGLTNISKDPTNKSYLRIVFGNIFTFFNILMFVIAIILVAIVGKKVLTNLMFLVIIFSNLLIGTIQECKSKHTIEKLKLLSNSKSKVRRNGKDVEILPHEIVLDDVIVLSPGDQIPVDGMILGEEIIEVNESLLTGESVPVKKSKGDTLYAGSFIVSGVNYLRADKIGNDTYIKSIEGKAKLSKQPKSRLMIAINKIIRVMAIIAIPLAFIVFINEFLSTVINPVIDEMSGNPVPMFPSYWGQESAVTNAVFYSGVTIAYMIPYGMALLASVAMATGVVKLAQSNTLAQSLYSVELLSRVNTLCLDKTGTLTDGTMSVEDYKVFDEMVDGQLISSYLSAFEASNQTSIALINKFGNTRTLEINQTIQFSSARKYSAVKFNKYGWFAMGAPEYLTKDEAILNEVKEHASNGLRVVLLARVLEDFKDEDKLPNKKEIVAMFIIRDTIRPEVYDTMRWFHENDVDIKVISGDNVRTVSYIAKQCGIENYDKYIDLSTIKETDNLEEIVMNNTIFGRVNPDQKADIIAILKKNGRITGVTGDGLNDLLAFKQADCSIALANGAAATKNVANLILLDSNFANMKEAVFQGRRVVNNIQRSASLFVMKDFLWLFITLLPIFLGIRHMIQPTVMSVVNIFITGIASLFVALEPDKTRVKGSFFKNVVRTALISGFYMFIPIVLIMVYFLVSQLITTQTFDLSLLETKFVNGEITEFRWIPLMSLCVTVSGFVIFFDNCRPFTKFRKVLFGCTLGLVLIVLYLIPEFFIISGTNMLKEAMIDDSLGLLNIFVYEVNHLGPNAMFALYRTMSLENVLFLVIYSLLAYPLYLLNKKVVGKLLDVTLFSKREYRDE